MGQPNVRVVNLEQDLRPLGAFASVAVTATPGPLTVNPRASHVLIQARGGDVLYRLDGVNPGTPAGTGFVLKADAQQLLKRESAEKLRVVRASGDCTLAVQHMIF
jgi:hypothetical protein